MGLPRLHCFEDILLHLLALQKTRAEIRKLRDHLMDGEEMAASISQNSNLSDAVRPRTDG